MRSPSDAHAITKATAAAVEETVFRPVVKSLPKPPGELTTLSKNTNGVFPISRVYDVIDGRMQVVIHGTREMPVWGDVFRRELMARVPRESMSPEVQDAIVRIRIFDANPRGSFFLGGIHHLTI